MTSCFAAVVAALTDLDDRELDALIARVDSGQ
jgi:hypothetical protein